jgi:sodium/proline symporter
MGWIVVVFVLYMTGMIFIGVHYFKRSDNLSDYFIGGRRLNSWVAAFSVYASDMSGWLMLGFIGAVYANGTGEVWIALGLVLGSVLNWILVGKRLRRYSLTAKYSITIPEFFENRFRDSTHTLRLISSLFIILFFTVYTAAGFVACGTLFSQIFGIDYPIALLAGAVVIVIYTTLGGFRAVCWTDFFQGLIMLAVIVTVPVVVICLTGGFSGILAELPPAFLDPLRDGAGAISAVSIVSGLTWGLGYFGMPHILVRFMAVENERSVSRAMYIAGGAIIVSLAGAVVMGIVGRAIIPETSDFSRILIMVIQKIFTDADALLPVPVLGGVFFCGIFAAIMSTADSQLILSASALTSDLYRGLVHRDGKDKYYLRFSRISVVAVSIVAYLIARDQSSTLLSLVSNAWSGFGSAFGALILLSLYWMRLTREGAVAGICSGGLTVILWDYISFIPRDGRWLNLGEATGLYSLAPGFCLSFFFIVVVSLATKPPSVEILEEFEIAATQPILEE